jgi:hypothetical protein
MEAAREKLAEADVAAASAGGFAVGSYSRPLLSSTYSYFVAYVGWLHEKNGSG